MIPDINTKLQALTPQHQQSVLSFIEFLAAQELLANSPSPVLADQPSPTVATEDWQTDPFFGIWRDRPDLPDSTTWVRQIRQQQWSR